MQLDDGVRGREECSRQALGGGLRRGLVGPQQMGF
jgi:hypothetical protein